MFDLLIGLTDSLFSGENLGCFGASKKKKDGTTGSGGLGGNQKESASSSRSTSRNEPMKGTELLWQPEVNYAFSLKNNRSMLKPHIIKHLSIFQHKTTQFTLKKKGNLIIAGCSGISSFTSKLLKP